MSFLGMAAATGVVFILVYPGVVKWLPGLGEKLNSLWVPFIVTALLGMVFWWAVKNRHGIIGTGMAGLLLIIVGYSTYTMIYVRSGLNPPIDENDPDSPARFLSYLNREQYGDRDMFPRVWKRNPAYSSEWDYFWSYQVNKMFNRYLLWQFVGREGAPHREFQDAGVEPNYSFVSMLTDKPEGLIRWFAILTCAPLLLGLIGFFQQFGKDKSGWLVVATIFFMTGYAVIVYLNQDDPQPRERDYSYVGAFFAFAIWIGLGAASVIEWVSNKLKGSQAMTAGVVGLLILLSPVMLLAKNYSMNDRSDNMVAWDYSYNMLMSCEQNGLLFTNGDNDTFPVWYLQEVAGVRKDVRVCNLSLLNTGWYVKQLRDREPKVPISFNDAYVDRYVDGQDEQALISRYWPPEKREVTLETPDGPMKWTVPGAMYVRYKPGEDRTPNFLRVQDWMILDILRTNFDRTKTPNPRPVYFAVTVANSNMVGLRDFLTMEGLVFRVDTKPGRQIGAQRLLEHVMHTFPGHFRGIADPGVHFDDNVWKLLQNYRSAFLQLAYYYRSQPDQPGTTPSGYTSLEDQVANFDRLSNREKALVLMKMMEREIPESVRPIGNVELSLQLGRMYDDLGEPEEMRKRLEWALQRNDLSTDSRLKIAASYAGSFKDTAKAADMVRDALGASPSSDQLFTAGSSMYQAGAFELAADYFDRCLKQDPRNGQAIGGMLQSLEALGRLEQAVQVLESWLATTPNDAGARRRLQDIQNRLAARDTGATRN
ncbi:tetratricopeptide repeat protein [bacterium]|nr:tetratricopeptide repeat protein [bacterium]